MKITSSFVNDDESTYIMFTKIQGFSNIIEIFATFFPRKNSIHKDLEISFREYSRLKFFEKNIPQELLRILEKVIM